ncbi:MAG: hypothetical protein WD873_07305 [Candidatus Hydrogenedentales bacterium]
MGAVLFAAGAWAQAPEPSTREPITFSGRGNGPVAVSEPGGKVEIVFPGGRVRPADPTAGEDPDNAESTADAGDQPPAPTPAEEEKPEPRMDLIRKALERELTQTSQPVLPPRTGGGVELETGVGRITPTRTSAAREGALGAEAGADALPELTEEELKILEEVRQSLEAQSAPRLPSWEDQEMQRVNGELQPEDVEKALELRQDFLQRAAPQLPPAAQERAREDASDRVKRGIDPATVNVGVPQHLMQQPPPQLPQSVIDRKERRKNAVGYNE